MAPKTNRPPSDALSYPDEGFYDGPDAESGETADEGWCEDAPVVRPEAQAGR